MFKSYGPLHVWSFYLHVCRFSTTIRCTALLGLVIVTSVKTPDTVACCSRMVAAHFWRSVAGFIDTSKTPFRFGQQIDAQSGSGTSLARLCFVAQSSCGRGLTAILSAKSCCRSSSSMVTIAANGPCKCAVQSYFMPNNDISGRLTSQRLIECIRELTLYYQTDQPPRMKKPAIH